MPEGKSRRDTANGESFRRLCEADPVLVDVLPAIDVVPGMTRETILTSGPPMPWKDYIGGQRDAVIGAALFEGVADSAEDADAKFSSGELQVDGCHDHKCVGSLAGVYSASMPVFVVENRAGGNIAFCNMYEGTNPRRLNYGVYDEGVKERLLSVSNVIAPVIGETVRRAGGVPLKPMIKRALHMGDELHSRSTAASLLLTREIFPHMLEAIQEDNNLRPKAERLYDLVYAPTVAAYTAKFHSTDADFAHDAAGKIELFDDWSIPYSHHQNQVRFNNHIHRQMDFDVQEAY